MTTKNYVVRGFLHWLQSDDNLTAPLWVVDIAEASLHTKDWAENYKLKNPDTEIYSIDDIVALMKANSEKATFNRFYPKVVKCLVPYKITEEDYTQIHHLVPALFKKNLTVDETTQKIVQSLNLKKE